MQQYICRKIPYSRKNLACLQKKGQQSKMKVYSNLSLFAGDGQQAKL